MSGSFLSGPFIDSSQQLNHIGRVDAEEDVQDFGILGSGFDPLGNGLAFTRKR